MRHAWLGSPILALALASSAPAEAGDPAAAEALFRAGRTALSRGDYATACAKFAESQRLDPAAGTLINLGECSERLGLLATAWQYYHAAADRLAGDARIDIVNARLADLERRLSRLTLTLAPGAPPGTHLTRDGEPLGDASLGVAVPVDKGPHVVVVSSPGRSPREVAITLDVGESKTVAVEPGPATANQGSSGGGLRTGGIVVLGLGAASLAVGIATGIMTMQRKSAVEANCKQQVCNPDGVQAASEGKTFSAVSTTTFVVGLAALAAGATMIAVGTRAPPPSTAFVISPAIGPGSGGVVARMVF
jgi:hypothetical protein